MNIAFRVDISGQLGTGHYMRMSALADAFAELGYSYTFFTSEDEPIDFSGFDIVILDTYLVNDEYIERLHKKLRESEQLFVCYDDNALYTYRCDVILNANLHAPELTFKTAGKPPRMLLGGSYALLRREFRESSPVKIKDQAFNVFVCFGGSDMRDMTPLVVEALQEIEGVRLNVILGSYTKCDDMLRRIAGSNVTIYKTPESVCSVMSQCDIAVTSSGTISYELAAIGLPAITIAQADNQFLIAGYMTRAGLMKNIGDWQSTGRALIKHEAEALLHDYGRRCREAAMLTAAVDKNGAVNAAREIIRLSRRL